MASSIENHAFMSGMLAALNEGTVSVPYLLLKSYPSLGLIDEEAMLLIHLIAFQEREDKGFPTIEELQARMSAKSTFVAETLQKFVKLELLSIEEGIDESGIRYETYNLQPLYEQMVKSYIDETLARVDDVDNAVAVSHELLDNQAETTLWIEESEKSKQIFHAFEQEYARPLSPMEYEAISGWIDRYNEELILLALREAVFAGKLHFRYIDRILLEWERQRIKTVEQARAFTQKFRGGE